MKTINFAKEPSNIIIRMPNWLGDLVMATPVLTDVRRHWPQARITAMASSSVCPILEKDPDIDELFCFSKPNGLHRREEQRKILDKIRQGHYDLGILLTNSFSSALWFWRGGVQKRIGYAGHYRRLLLSYAVKDPETKDSQHLVNTYKMILQPCGIPLSNTAPRIHLSKEECQEARDRLRKYGIKDNGVIIGINPGAAYGSAKCWLPERFQELTFALLKDPRISIVYFGDSAGASLVQSICLNMPPKVVNLAGQTSLRELASLINACDIFLTNDSGPMHIASALNVPLLALFGSTNDRTTGPYQGGKVIHKHVDCSPCYLRTCPTDFRCMKRIEVAEVYDELQQLISQQSNNTLSLPKQLVP